MPSHLQNRNLNPVNATTLDRAIKTRNWIAFSLLPLAALLAWHADTRAQTTLNNPLMRPAQTQRETITPPLPAGAPPQARSGDGPVQAKSLQEEVNANIQKLNAERVPMPLRILLATVYVSAINGPSAVLRQPIPPAQQAALAAPGTGIAGMAGATNAGAIGGMIPGAMNPGLPGALPGAMTGGIPGAAVGGIGAAIPGAPLSTGVGLVNPFAAPPPRPTSIRVRDGETFSLQGYEMQARVRDLEVTLLWNNSEDKQTIVFQSSIESPSLPAYIPPSASQEKPDSGYFNRVQAGSIGGTTPAASSSTGTGSGTGAR